MDNTLDYIFRALGKSERMVNKMARALVKQRGVNKTVFFFAATTAAYAIVNNIRANKIEERMYELEKELRELKETEEEEA